MRTAYKAKSNYFPEHFDRVDAGKDVSAVGDQMTDMT